MSTKKGSKTLGERVFGAQDKLEYLKVTYEDGKPKLGHVKLTGAKAMWDPSKQKLNFIYAPGIRLAGTTEDIQRFLRENKVNDAQMADFLAGAYTSQNWSSPAQHQYFIWTKQQVLSADGKKTEEKFVPQKSAMSTYADDFKDEVKRVQDATKAANAEAKGSEGMDYEQIFAIGEALDNWQGATSTKTKGKGGGGKKGSPEAALMKAIADGKVYNVTNMTNTGTGGRAVLREKMPQNAVFLDTNSSSPFASAFFTYKAGAKIPDGPRNFLILVKQGDQARADQIVRARINGASSSATGMALPSAPAAAAAARASSPSRGALPLPPTAKSPARVPSALPRAGSPAGLPSALPGAGLSALPSALPSAGLAALPSLPSAGFGSAALPSAGLASLPASLPSLPSLAGSLPMPGTGLPALPGAGF